MPRRISTLLNKTSKELADKGVFDGFIDIDSRLHVDPSLLAKCKIPEFEFSQKEFEKYFNDVLVLIEGSQKTGDKLWAEAYRRLQFKENANSALGYAKGGTSGNAIGPKLAENILNTVSQIVKAGVKDPIIFELVGVIEEHIGADRISDMTIEILIKNFASFTQRVAKELNITTRNFNIQYVNFSLPFDPITNKSIILIPQSLLNNLPLARDWDDIDRICRYNRELRMRVNNIIGNSWKSAIKIKKSEFKKIILENPELLKDLIEQYKGKIKTSYDFVNDPLGELVWAELSERASKEYPLNIKHLNPVTPENIFSIVKTICEQFASLIENNGWFEYLYDNKMKLKPERAPQLLFYGIAEVYCIANNLDINRETNAGVGSLDFKLSKGYEAKVNVELKYSSNPNLIKGFEKQLPTYNKAEKTNTSIYLIIQTKRTRKNIDAVVKLADKMKQNKQQAPEIFIIDGRRQISASKRR